MVGMAEVEIDKETGELELILASDSGKLDAVRLGGTAVSSASGTLRW